MTGIPIPARAVAVGAHPDDIEFGCGATLAQWAEHGSDVRLVILTDGSKGTWDPDADIEELVAVRHAEQLDAAKALGASVVEFVDLVDGELDVGPTERGVLCELLRALRPDVVLGHDPWKRYRLHPDHRRAGELLLDALVAARDPKFFPGRGVPHRPGLLLLFEADEADHAEDVASGLDAKLAALRCHVSQWRSTMGIEAGSPEETAQRAAFEARVRRDAEEAGAPFGLAVAEAFKVMREL